MSDLLFIRHAETDLAGKFCGHADPPINAAGHRQIDKLLESLRSEKIAAIFTSDLERAKTTARALAEFFAVPCVARQDLREIGFGAWETLTWEQVETLDSTFARQWLDQFPQLTPPQGEAFETFQARVMAAVSELLSRPRCGPVALVTHAGVMRVVLQNFCGIAEKAAWTLTKSYCCTFRYVHHAHLGERLQEVRV